MKTKDIERTIATKLIDLVLAAGYGVRIDNGGDSYENELTTDRQTILNTMFATGHDCVCLFKDGKRVGWVNLIYGNCGWDVVADYSGALAEADWMIELNQFADDYCE